MKMHEEVKLYLRPRPVERVSINVPTDTLDSLKKVAVDRDMSYQVLLKLYIGQGLRQDLAKLFSARIKTTAQVFEQHIQSEEQASEIIPEIRVSVG